MKTKFLKGVIGQESAAGSSESVVAQLCDALRNGHLDAAILFRACGVYKEAAKPSATQANPYDKDWAKVLKIIKREFKKYLGKGKGVSEFLAGRAQVATAFAANKDDYCDGSREYELGEELAGALIEAFDLCDDDGDEHELHIDMLACDTMKLEQFVEHVLAIVKPIKAALGK